MDIFSYKLGQKSGGGSGGGADWNASEGEAGYVKNRTHYEDKAFEPITYSNETPTLDTATMSGMPFLKISEEYFQLNSVYDVVSVTMSSYIDGEWIDDIMPVSPDSYMCRAEIYEHGWMVNPALLVSDGELVMGGITFGRGIWGIDGAAMGTPQYRITIDPAVVTCPLDPKYLPKHAMSEVLMANLAGVLSLNSLIDIDQTKGATLDEIAEAIENRSKLVCVRDTNGVIYAASDYPNFVEGATEKYITLTSVYSAFYDGSGMIGNTVLRFAKLFYAGKNAGKVQLARAFRIASGDNLELATKESGNENVFNSTNIFKKETTLEGGAILTSPSGKKFKLTVDDSGTVSAVEVTE